TIRLYELSQDQRVEFVYRGISSFVIKVDALLPRRVLQEKSAQFTLTTQGVPLDKELVKLYIGEQALTIEDIKSNSETGGTQIITASLQGISEPGLYDLVLSANISGIWQQSTLNAALAVDAPIHFDSVLPKWGPLQGGSTVIITGAGFEPGNTVLDAIKIKVGSLPAGKVDVLSTKLLTITTPSGNPGKQVIIGENRYGEQTKLTGENSFGYGLKQLSATKASMVFPNQVYIDPETGVAITNGGYFKDGYSLESFGGLSLPNNMRAASFDIEDPYNPLLVGGEEALSAFNRQKMLSPESDLSELPPYALDSLQILPITHFEESVLRKRLLVANGDAGVSQLNLDEQNGLQWVNDQPLSNPVESIAHWGSIAFASTAELTPDVGKCSSKASYNPAAIKQIGYQVAHDPVNFGKLANISAGHKIYRSGPWLYSGGNGNAIDLLSDCEPPLKVVFDRAANGESGSIKAINLLDPLLTTEYLFDNNVFDYKVYGDHLIVALGDKGVEILHKEFPEQRVRIDLGAELQTVPGKAINLTVIGSTLAVAANNGLVYIDISEPMSPVVISAGNDQHVEATNVYKGRVVAAAGTDGLRIFDLPGALVKSASIPPQGLLSQNAQQLLTIEFTELVEKSTIVSELYYQAPSSQIWQLIDKNWSDFDAHEDKFNLEFSRAVGQYKLAITDVANLRGQRLWSPYLLTFSVTESDAIQPRIDYLSATNFFPGSQQKITVHGENFGPDAVIYVDKHLIAANRIDSNSIEIPAGALNLYEFEAGPHTVTVQDGQYSSHLFGALVAGFDLSVKTPEFVISPDSATSAGGDKITITSDLKVILPGTRVVLKAKHSEQEFYTGKSPFKEALSSETIQLKDDVVDLKTFNFILPTVEDIDLYNIYLRVPEGDTTKEFYIGDFSYTLEDGLGIQLPNYPPMKIGASQFVETTLFVGVKEGANPTYRNRFLMKSGLEIYDTSIWDRPIRLSQLPLNEPVTGLSVVDNIAYLANQKDGLAVVNVADTSQPLLLNRIDLPGHFAADLDINLQAGVLAVAAGNTLGSGYIRFFDITSDLLGPISGYDTINFSQQDGLLNGVPLDIEWHQGKLYVVHLYDDQQYISVISSFAGQPTVNTHKIERSDESESASLVVMDGLIALAVDNELLVFEESNDTLQLTYWQQTVPSSTLINNQGALFISNQDGVVISPIAYLALSDVTPEMGSSIAKKESINLWFNNHIDTSHADRVIQLTDAQGTAIDSTFYEVTSSNTLSGALVEITISEDATYNGLIKVVSSEPLLDIHGNALIRPLDVDYTLKSAIRPVITGINRVTDAGELGAYFHADGTENAVVSGLNFGDQVGQIRLYLGEQLLAENNITDVTDNQIQIKVPDLGYRGQSLALSLKVKRIDQGLEDINIGAFSILPQIEIDELNPKTGPPQGGNLVHIYGRGFNHNMKVTIADNNVGYLNVISSDHIVVRAPSGTYGSAKVKIESLLFSGEFNTSAQEYFYTGNGVASVQLPSDQSSPVAALQRKGQMLYAITGGSFDITDKSGKIVKRLSGQSARLVLADVSDPVNPIILEKEIAGKLQPYHFALNIAPEGFSKLEVNGNNLLVAGANKLYLFDITLPADPLLQGQPIQLSSTINDIVFENDLVYISSNAGLSIYRLNADRQLERIKLLD
ncbi:MAG: hypothetical protein GY951_13105, partial [Psychromonas sp.]|nr:hypothetical protein [Psychromonas sp.]